MGENIKCYLNVKKTNERKTTPVHIAVTAETFQPGREIPSRPWNYKVPNFPYHTMYNWNGGGAFRQLSVDS
jgi:hypothetical protein